MSKSIDIETSYTIEDVTKAFQILNLIDDQLHRESSENDIKQRITNIIAGRRRVSPRYIESLDPNEVFVFGSNSKGMHLGRASKMAYENFGAIMGQAEGFQGSSYAIITTQLACDKYSDNENWEGIGKNVYENIKKSAKSQDKPYSECEKEETDKEGFKYTPETDLNKIGECISRFISFARKTAEEEGDKIKTHFLVTRVACGFSGKKDEEIAKKFREALELPNVYLPQSFIDCLYDNYNINNPSRLIPTQSNGTDTFVQQLDGQLSRYTKYLLDNFRSHNNVSENEENRHLYDDVEFICNKLVNAVTLYFKGLPAQAYESASEAMKKAFVEKINDNDSLKLSVVNVNDGEYFFRIRPEEDKWVKRDVNKYGMFHIPLSLRSIVKTQRYSIGGYPCLYLGTSIFTCWEEMGRPNLNDCLVSRVENVKEFKAFDITIPDEKEWDKEINEIKDLILRFPIIIACTFRAHDNKAIFKPEYIIPQLVLQWVKEKAYDKNKKMKNEEKFVYGIKYTSVNYKLLDKDSASNFKFEDDKYTNYVLPVLDIKDEYCSVLCNTFKITDPICEEYERIKHNVSAQNPSDNESVQSVSKIYEDTIFGNLESILKRMDAKVVYPSGKDN